MHEFIESSVFAKYVYDYLTDEEYAAMQWYLSQHVDVGDLIPGSGGCRKMRWGCGRQRQAWRRARYLLRSHPGRTDLVAGHLCEVPADKSPSARHTADQGPYGEVMKKLSKEIIARDAKRNIGEEVLQAIREIKAGGGRRFTVQVSQATEARLKLGQSQADFAEMLGVSVRTLQDWEQGRREPSGAAKALLKVAVAAPKMVRKVLAAA
jgi:putative transcriptional regulator